MNDLIEDFKQIENGVGNLQERIDQMVARKTQLAEFLATMFPEPSAGASDRVKNEHIKKIRAIAQRIMNERVATGNLTTTSTRCLRGKHSKVCKVSSSTTFAVAAESVTSTEPSWHLMTLVLSKQKS